MHNLAEENLVNVSFRILEWVRLKIEGLDINVVWFKWLLTEEQNNHFALPKVIIRIITSHVESDRDQSGQAGKWPCNV